MKNTSKIILGVAIGSVLYWASKTYLGGIVTDLITALLVFLALFMWWKYRRENYRLKREIARLGSEIESLKTVVERLRQTGR